MAGAVSGSISGGPKTSNSSDAVVAVRAESVLKDLTCLGTLCSSSSSSSPSKSSTSPSSGSSGSEKDSKSSGSDQEGGSS